eukprot:2664902-Amphidinium_carterae.2
MKLSRDLSEEEGKLQSLCDEGVRKVMSGRATVLLEYVWQLIGHADANLGKTLRDSRGFGRLIGACAMHQTRNYEHARMPYRQWVDPPAFTLLTRNY